MFGEDRQEKKLREHGQRAQAEVLEAQQAGYGVTEGNPAFAGATEVVWKLKLQVRPEGGEPFEADVKARFLGTAFANNPALAASPMAGSIEEMMREAMADPTGLAEKMRAQSAPWVAAMGTPASSGDATIDQLEKLTELRDKGALSPEEFEAQKKRILGET
jgi:hypothetical protein